MVAYRVVCSGTLYGVERWANTFHVDVTEPINLTAVEDAFEDFYNPSASPTGVLLGCTGNAFGGSIIGVQLTKIATQRVSTPGVPSERIVAINGGQNTEGGLPLDVAEVITWMTDLAGRRYRGRTYLPPFNSNQLTDASGVTPRITNARITQVAAAAEALVGALQTAGAPLGVYSRVNSAIEPVTALYVNDEWDTQRRRSNNAPTSRIGVSGL